jgi:hypothetical protein
MTEGLKGQERRDKGRRALALGLLTLLCLGLTPVGAVGAVFSPLVFDNRSNLLNPLAWLAFILIIAFWIVCLLAPFVAWVTWSRNQERLAWLAIATPLLWAVTLILTLQFIPW